MNYFGADGSREMLATICERLGTSDVPVRVIDIGAGFGGTSRVMVSELEQLGYVGSSAAASPMPDHWAARTAGQTPAPLHKQPPAGFARQQARLRRSSTLAGSSNTYLAE